MIKEITMKNVKGQTAVQTLTGKDIIIGRNGAGKTTRMQTIGLAMLGYVPGKGKTTADTFKLASDDEMTVGMKTDSFDIERTYTKSRKLNKSGEMDVKISQTLVVSPSMGETTNAQKEKRIQQELGDFPVMLDFGSFIAMTDNQQRDFIYSLSGGGFSWDRERVATELRNATLNPDMIDTNPDLYECMSACIEDTMRQYREGIDVDSGILAMSEHAKDKLKYWKKEKVNADGAARKLTELKNKATETDRDLTINLEKMKQLQDQKEQIIKDLAELSAKNKALDEKEKELQKLREEIGGLETTPDSEKIATLNEEISELGVAIANGNSIAEDLAREAELLQNEMASLKSAEKTKNEEMMGLKEQLATVNAEIKANSDLLHRIAESNGCCAFSPNIPCRQDFSEFIEQTNEIMDTAYDLKDAIEHSCDEIRKALADIQVKIEETEKSIKNCDKGKKLNEKNLNLSKTLLDEHKAALQALESREPVLIAKRQREAEIAAYLAENQKVDLTAMEDQKTLVSGQIESLTATIDQQKKVRNDLANIKANIIDSKTADFNVLCWTQISRAIGQKGIKGCIMKEMLDPLLEDVNAKLHEIGIEEEFFFETKGDTGKEIFEFGWSGKPFDALSTGEQLLLMTALMTAMIERANPPVKVLAIDNINDLDAHNLNIIMRGFGTIGKNMDNVILAGVVEPTEEASAGWKVWRL